MAPYEVPGLSQLRKLWSHSTDGCVSFVTNILNKHKFTCFHSGDHNDVTIMNENRQLGKTAGAGEEENHSKDLFLKFSLKHHKI